MKKSNTNPMEDYLKVSLPQINWDIYKLMWVETWEYTGQYADTFKHQMTLTIQEDRGYEEWMNPEERYVRWYHEVKHDDRPIRDNAVVIIERRKKRKNKVNGNIYTSSKEWFAVFEATSRALDQLSFLK
jgi:hypothetical protein